LTTTENQRRQRNFRRHKQRTGADRSPAFVAGDRNQVGVSGEHIKLTPGQGLNGVGMKHRAGGVTSCHLNEGRDVVNHPGLVVDGDDRHHRNLTAMRIKNRGEAFRRNRPIGFKSDRDSARGLNGFEHRVMFTRAAHRQPSRRVKHTTDRQVVGFAPTRGKDQFRRWALQSCGDLITGIVEGSPRGTSRPMRTGGVGMVLLGGVEPGLAGRFAQWGTGRMVEVHLNKFGGFVASHPLSLERGRLRDMTDRLEADSEYRASTYGESFADVYDDWYSEVSDVAGCVAALHQLADGHPILELGIGTGRLALPLAQRGVSVVGVDASPSMLARLAEKPGAETLHLYEGDMAAIGTGSLAAQLGQHGPYGVVFAAFNTFFNLTSDTEQNRCLAGARSLLRPGGLLVLEGFVPPTEGLADGGVSVRDVTADSAVLTVSKHDADQQLIRGHHIEIRADGNRLRPWQIHYRYPAQLDAAAADAGFVLADRWRNWHGEPFLDNQPINPDEASTRETEIYIGLYRNPQESV
jgi:SAM-dependent methyltransferase